MTESNKLETCDECKNNYPIGYCRTFYMGLLGTSFVKFVCGICALELGNKIHRIKRLKFHGKVAEELRQKAIKYRKTLEKQ